MRSHLLCCPIRKVTIVHCKAVMMFEHRYNIAGARGLKELSPCLRVEVFRFKSRDEIFVSKRRHWTIGSNVMFVYLGSFDVHLTWIPLITECRNRVHSPMNEDAELRILVPRRNLV